jgi:hypothetical protein
MPVLDFPSPCLVLAVLLSSACSGVGEGPDIIQRTRASDEQCDGALAWFQVVEIAKRAMAATGGDPESLEREFDVEIHRKGCDYFLSALHRESTLHFRISVSPTGEILSPPWCCVPGYEVDTTDLIERDESDLGRGCQEES